MDSRCDRLSLHVCVWFITRKRTPSQGELKANSRIEQTVIFCFESTRIRVCAWLARQIRLWALSSVLPASNQTERWEQELIAELGLFPHGMLQCSCRTKLAKVNSPWMLGQKCSLRFKISLSNFGFELPACTCCPSVAPENPPIIRPRTAVLLRSISPVVKSIELQKRTHCLSCEENLINQLLHMKLKCSAGR